MIPSSPTGNSPPGCAPSGASTTARTAEAGIRVMCECARTYDWSTILSTVTMQPRRALVHAVRARREVRVAGPRRDDLGRKPGVHEWRFGARHLHGEERQSRVGAPEPTDKLPERRTPS